MPQTISKIYYHKQFRVLLATHYEMFRYYFAVLSTVTNSGFIRPVNRSWAEQTYIYPVHTGPKPFYYLHGSRKLNIILTHLRCSASFLNADLFKVNITLNPQCRRGALSEVVYHFFMKCPCSSERYFFIVRTTKYLSNFITVMQC